MNIYLLYKKEGGCDSNDDFKLKWEFPWIRPRYKTVEWVTKIYEDIMPKFKAVVNESPELQKKLQEYLAPDYEYYIKAV